MSNQNDICELLFENEQNSEALLMPIRENGGNIETLYHDSGLEKWV
eukprot:CAMPEP_0115032786 /NCGR_PEP_ID=MMETSP0216-20121206/39382_1 /TAXON_ID=223996 /ORGANISM="Protocruzia adherens, Strain Boccale" /LENGTH=45 /DNA_ID= /DNA_START= /DNA_END= /DNA_ORIENTATION=